MNSDDKGKGIIYLSVVIIFVIIGLCAALKLLKIF